MLLVPVKEVSVLSLFPFNAVSSLFRLQRYSKKRNNANNLASISCKKSQLFILKSLIMTVIYN